MKCSYCSTDILICLNAENACEFCLYSGAIELRNIEMCMNQYVITTKTKKEILDMINTIRSRQRMSFREWNIESVKLVLDAETDNS